VGASQPPPVDAVTSPGLADKIARRIRAEGPLSVAAYTAIALYDPELGYYATQQPVGARGDFITAPEISQIFGELVGLWCALMWEEIGRPDPVLLAELGPGSGALAIDLLRSAAVSPQFRRALHPYLVEVSPRLRSAQQHRLGTDDIVWLTRIEDLPDGPLLLVANEFLDALPIRQLVRGRRHWRERSVALNPENRLAFADGPENPLLSLLIPEVLRISSPPGAIFEISPSALAIAGTLGAKLRRRRGAALFIDYGRSESATGASLRAVSDHRSTDPLSTPGRADLSADVDFAAFAEAAGGAGADLFGPVPQGAFLRRLGAVTRLQALSARASSQQREQLEAGLLRLLDPDQMGTLFKVMALTSPGLRVPPGFDDEERPPR
jgi:NADH dehydrogenase [ubiquinone] 1 alpha subcomplex assembly factor 7